MTTHLGAIVLITQGLKFTQLNDDGQNFMATYVNRSNNKTKVKYSSYEGECFIVVWAISPFWCYLYGSPFSLVMDHQPLKFLMELNCFIRKLVMWALILLDYDFDIVYRVGKVNHDVNGLRWNPSSNEEATNGACWHDDVNLEAISS